MIKRVLVFCLFAISLSGCGPAYKEKDIKNFVLATPENDDKIKDLLSKLVSEFNSYAGFNALTFSYDTANSNSPVNIVVGLEDRTNHIGETQSIVDTESDFELGSYVGVGQRPERRNYYSMHIDLDRDFIEKRIDNNDQASHYDLQKLFFHEVGHGLTMDHVPSKSDVMYASIDGNKDFAGFFRRVRAFFGIRS